jgi:hypothetical protein
MKLFKEWKYLKAKGRIQWMLGLRCFSKWGWVPSLFWQPLAPDVAVQLGKALEQQRATHEREMAELKASVGRILPKLVKITTQRDSFQTNNQFRLILELDPFLIRDAFEFGNDDRAMRYFCENIGHMAYRELKTMNLHRFNDPRFGGMRY